MTLQVRVKAKFPGQVAGGTGMSVTKSGGVWTFAQDWSSLSVTTSISATISATVFVPFYDSATSSYGISSIETLQTTINAGLDDTLVAMAALAPAANEFIYFDGADSAKTATVSAPALTLLDDASISAMRTTLGLAIGTDVQAYDAGLADISGITASTSTIIVGDGANWGGQSGSVARTSLGLAIGTDVQAYNASLTAIAAISPTTNTVIIGDGTSWGTGSIGVDIQSFNQYLQDISDISGTSGSIFYIDGSGTVVNLGAGSDGQFLAITASIPYWGTPAGGGDVTAANAFGTDNVLLRSDGTGKGAQSTTISFSDAGVMNFADAVIQRPEIKDYSETANDLGSLGGGTVDLDVESGNVILGTVTSGTTTFTFSNPSPTGKGCSFTLILTNGGSQTVNWPGAVAWSGGTAPALTASGVDVLTFVTADAGTIWYGFVAGLDMS